MENQIKGIARNWYWELIIGILFIAVGVWVFMTPVSSYVALSVFFAVTFLRDVCVGLAQLCLLQVTQRMVGLGWWIAVV